MIERAYLYRGEFVTWGHELYKCIDILVAWNEQGALEEPHRYRVLATVSRFLPYSFTAATPI